MSNGHQRERLTSSRGGVCRLGGLAAIAWLSLLAGLAGLAGCSDSGGETVHRYTTRGIVQSLPSADRPGGSLMVRHEAIPGYVKDGEVVGMESMTMAFPVGEGVSLEGIEACDKVRLTFEVRTGEWMEMETLAIEPLPAETELDLPGADQGEAEATTRPGAG